MTIGSFKQNFDTHLSEYIDERINRIKTLVPMTDVQAVVQAIRDVALMGGKRARPFMAEAMYTALAKNEGALPTKVGLGLELFHLFCLVHDDIIDRADTRHGASTIQVVAEKVLPSTDDRDRQHLANSQALLAGDLLFAWASEAFRDGVTLSAYRDQALRVYFQMIDDVVSGQMIDVSLMARVEADEAIIRKKMELKTATYTFVRPLQIGAALAGTNGKFDAVLADFGLAIGFAFQLQDDYLDLTSTADTLGKPCMNDMREGQHTLLTANFLQRANPEDALRFKTLFGRTDLSTQDCEEILAMMGRTGVLSYAEQELHQAFAQARNIVQNSVLPDAAKAVLQDLTTYIQARTT